MCGENPTTARGPRHRSCVLAALGLLTFLAMTASAQTPGSHVGHRSLHSLDAGWRFQHVDVDGAQAPEFDDSAWTPVDVPHDWSIAGPRSADAASGMGGGYAPSGIGWYRQAFDAPADWSGRAAWIEFDGVYMNATVWLNGHRLGAWPYGYSTFRFDLAPHLKAGARNVIAVRVDNSAQPNSRWYSGSGIYRSVRIVSVDPVHVAPHGVFVEVIDATPANARLVVHTTIRNTGERDETVRLESRITGRSGSDADADAQSTGSAGSFPLRAGEEHTVRNEFTLENPALWSPDSPHLYTVATSLATGDAFRDTTSTVLGVRTVRVSAERGFELNGRPVTMNGANVHHDHGPLGAASYRDVEFRRARLLKAAGFNAVRTAHNPPAPDFLDACDEIGLLVMDETFDCWEKGKNPADYSVHFKEWWQRDFDAMILRDRNHPSVVMWSIGNEVGERGLPAGLPIAQKLAARARELDPTRPVTCGWNFPWSQAEWVDMDPMYAAVDIAGYNYEHRRHADDHARVPQRVILATESYQADTFPCWEITQDHPCFIGDFVWSGIDYLGESGIGRVYPSGEKVFQHWETQHWPWFGAYCGDIDITGRRKPISHYRAIVWDRGEKLYMAVQEPPPSPGAWQPTYWGLPPTLDSWTWPGSEGRPLLVEVCSRHDSVRLFLDDRLVGEKPTTRAEAFKAVFEVPYAPGTLRAVGVTAGAEAETVTLETAGPAVGVRLLPDWGDDRLVRTVPTFAIAEIVDAQGRVVPTSAARIEFSVSPGARILAVATGDLTSPEPFVATERSAWHGRAQVIVMPGAAGDALVITATVPELGGATASLAAEPMSGTLTRARL